MATRLKSIGLGLIFVSLLSSLMMFGSVAAQDGSGTTPTPNVQGLQRVDQALQHLSGYLGLERVATLALMAADDENIPYISYRFDPVAYTVASLGCPQAGQTYAQREVSAYRILLTVRGYGTYDYRVSADGQVVILCRGGRPHSSSIGLESTTTGTVGNAPRQSGATAGLTGGVARLDQALRHVSAYLGLRTTITLAAVQNNDPFIVPTRYNWKPAWLFTSPAACPTIAAAYAPGSVYGYEITLTVNERNYTYYANENGSLLVLCINGSPARSSIFPS